MKKPYLKNFLKAHPKKIKALRINDEKINWENSDSHYFFNPQSPQPRKLQELARRLPFLKGHIYLFTSSLGKICLLSKEALLCSAEAVNQRLQTQKKDRWLISLPLFHIAGLSIKARGFCGGFSFNKSPPRWSPLCFQKELKEKKISLCSLVPAQIYDLIQKELQAPRALRAVLVGGGALSPYLYKKARRLGWPVLPSYGLTEAGSQVAGADLASLRRAGFPKMKILDHIQVRKTKHKTKIKSRALFTAYFDISKKKFFDPKDSKGFFELPDKTLINKGFLSVIGRKEDEIKILGERVNLQSLSLLLEKTSEKLLGKRCLVPEPHPRGGFQLALASECFDLEKTFSLVKKFNSCVLPFERIKNIYFVSKIERGALYKIRRKALAKKLKFPEIEF